MGEIQNKSNRFQKVKSNTHKTPGFSCILNEDKSKLIIEFPLEDDLLPSQTSGQTLIVASTHGVRITDTMINDRHLRIMMNAFIPIKTDRRCILDEERRIKNKHGVDKADIPKIIELTDELREMRGRRKHIMRKLRSFGHWGGLKTADSYDV